MAPVQASSSCYFWIPAVAILKAMQQKVEIGRYWWHYDESVCVTRAGLIKLNFVHTTLTVLEEPPLKEDNERNTAAKYIFTYKGHKWEENSVFSHSALKSIFMLKRRITW